MGKELILTTMQEIERFQRRFKDVTDDSKEFSEGFQVDLMGIGGSMDISGEMQGRFNGYKS